MDQSSLCPGPSVDQLLEILRETGSPTATNCGADQERPAINAFRALSTVLDRGARCLDCNQNSVPDAQDLLAATSRDVNSNGVPDECEPDCNSNDTPDDLDISEGGSSDCNLDGRPDECEVDCNRNGTPDECEIAEDAGRDCDASGTLDECEVALGALEDCNANGTPDQCEVGRFPTVLQGPPPLVEPSVFLGPPDGTSAGLGGDSVTYDLAAARIIDGEGPDFSVYEAEGRSVFQDLEFSALDVLVSIDGTVFMSVKASEQPLRRIAGDEAVSSTGFARSYDLETVGIGEARYVRLQGLGKAPAGSEDGFDLDAVGWIHYRACLLPDAGPTEFVRGDCNDDGDVNVADAACSLNYMFGGTAEPGCLASLNTNGDGDVNIADPVALLNFLFGGGPVIADPFPDCGQGALTADAVLGCANPPDCQ